MSGPLEGRTLVVTRAGSQAATLSGALVEAGADVVELPVIAIADPSDGGAALREAVAGVADYGWAVVTSPNGSERLALALGPRDHREGSLPKLAAIGPRTAAPLVAAGYRVDLVPGRAVAEGLLEEFPPGVGRRLLLVRAEVAREVLPAGLREAGWSVDVVVAYRNVAPEVAAGEVERAISADAVTFTSESTVNRYVEVAGGPVPRMAICIGPVTAAAARGEGFTVVEADPHSVAGMVDAACAWAAS